MVCEVHRRALRHDSVSADYPPARTVSVRYSAHFHAVMRMLKAPANLHWLLHHDAMWVVVIHNENNAQKSCQKRSFGDLCAFSLIGVLWVGYSWGIRGVFMGYTYVSGMCRECIGTYKVRGGLRYKIPCRYLQVSKKSSTFVGNFEAGSEKRELRILN